MATRPGESEYGGKGGILQRNEDGHSLTTAEEAMVLRRAGLRDAMNPQQETWNPERRGIDIVQASYTPEQAQAELEERK